MRLIVLSLFCMAIFSCKEITGEKAFQKEEDKIDKVIALELTGEPAATIRKIFKAHGGLETWKTKRTLTYTIQKRSPETHTIDLYSRDEKIETTNFSMGSKGKNIWLLDEKNNYKGDAVFYHNLMFYFYAMPFVLADNGIQYSETDALYFEGKTYPGIRISYDKGVGLSPKDEYFIHYNAQTHRMEWLGYTVTFKSGKKSENVKWIRYNDWMELDGLLLPKSLTWYNYEGRTIKDAKPPLRFEEVAIMESPLSPDFFDVPKDAEVVNNKIK